MELHEGKMREIQTAAFEEASKTFEREFIQVVDDLRHSDSQRNSNKHSFLDSDLP